MKRDDVKSKTLEELQAQFQAWREPAYRVTQMLDWLYQRRAANWDQMTNLPKPLRQTLAGTYDLHPLQLARKQGSRDTTQ